MKQVLGENDQSGHIDPEKAYFIEKFGYLVKNINSGYGAPIKEALIKRIFSAVDQFRADLPDVVRDIEIQRLKNLEERYKNIESQINSKIEADEVEQTAKSKAAEIKKEEIKELIPQVIKEKIVATAPKTEERVIIEEEIEISPIQASETTEESPIIESKPKILRPSAAAMVEENRQQQLHKIQAQKMAEQEQKSTPKVNRPAVKPKKELTVWERAWHRYGGYTDEVVNGHS